MFELAEDVVLHRMRLSYEALAEGQKPGQVLEGGHDAAQTNRPAIPPASRSVRSFSVARS